MADHLSPPVIEAKPAVTSLIMLVVVCCIFLYFSYRRLLPKPIPGIPYNKSAARSLLGDVPEMMSYISRTQEIWPWVADQTTKHQSPIVQVWGRPFSKPWVVVSDHREAQDILLRRKSSSPSKPASWRWGFCTSEK
jgi:hypothetical protein